MISVAAGHDSLGNNVRNECERSLNEERTRPRDNRNATAFWKVEIERRDECR